MTGKMEEEAMIDLPLLGVAALYFFLSWLMAWVILKLPVFCQTSWSLISVWGIVFVGLAEAWLRWNQPMLAQRVISDICIIFAAAFPGQLWLDFKQKQYRVTYWEREGLPDELQDRLIYLNRRNVFDWLALYTADYYQSIVVVCLVCAYWIDRLFDYLHHPRRLDS